jgi:predicted MFS family arabinose efflux permease
MKKIIKLYTASFLGLSDQVWILAFANMVNRAGSMVLSFMALYLVKDQGFTMTEGAQALSVYGIGSILGSYWGGWLSDRVHFKTIQIFSLVSSGVLLIPLMFFTNYFFILGNIFFFALISDCFRPANTIAVSHFAKIENRTRSFSLMRLAYNVGFSIGPAMGGIVAGSLGYKWLWFIDALTCIFAAFIIYRYLPNQNPDIVPPQADISETPSVGTSAYRDRNYLLFILFSVIYGICFFQLFTSMPIYLAQNLNYSEWLIGLLLGLNGLLVVIMEMPIVGKLEGYKRFMIIISIGVLCMALSFVFLLTGSSWVIWPILYVFFITISEIFAMPFMMNYSISRAHPSRVGQYVALYSIAYGIAIILAPYFGLKIAENYSFQTLFISLIGLSLLLSFGFFTLRKRNIHD